MLGDGYRALMTEKFKPLLDQAGVLGSGGA